MLHIALKEIQINSFVVTVYLTKNSALTFKEEEAYIANKALLEELIKDTWGLEGWEFAKVIMRDSGVL